MGRNGMAYSRWSCDNVAAAATRSSACEKSWKNWPKGWQCTKCKYWHSSSHTCCSWCDKSAKCPAKPLPEHLQPTWAEIAAGPANVQANLALVKALTSGMQSMGGAAQKLLQQPPPPVLPTRQGPGESQQAQENPRPDGAPRCNDPGDADGQPPLAAEPSEPKPDTATQQQGGEGESRPAVDKLKSMHEWAKKSLGADNPATVELGKQLKDIQQDEVHKKPIEVRLMAQSRKLRTSQVKLSKAKEKHEQLQLELAKALTAVQESDKKIDEMQERVEENEKLHQQLAKEVVPMDNEDEQCGLWQMLGIHHPVPSHLQDSLKQLHELANSLRTKMAETPAAQKGDGTATKARVSTAEDDEEEGEESDEEDDPMGLSAKRTAAATAAAEADAPAARPAKVRKGPGASNAAALDGDGHLNEPGL